MSSADWEGRMAARAQERRREWGEFDPRNPHDPVYLAAREREHPRAAAEQGRVDYCRGEGPPYCGEARQENGAWLVHVVCGSCVHGHRHHDDEIWLADAAPA